MFKLPTRRLTTQLINKHKSTYLLYDTSGGILSYSTKDIDTGEAVAEGFSNKEQQGFIKDNKKLLKESAEKYYSTMIKSLDHEAKVTIETQK